MRRPSVVSLLAFALAACSASSPSASPSPAASVPEASAESPDATTAAVVDLVPGRLDPGVTYVFPDFGGLAVRMDEEGWLAVLPNGGDVSITGGRTIAYFLRPDTVIAPDESGQIPWPTDVEGARAALESARGVTIESAEPITVGGVETELLTVSARNQSEAAPLFTTGSGEIGLANEENLVVLLPIEDEVIVIVFGGEGDLERTRDEGGTLLDALLFEE
jgi:hypothetical protein